MMVYKDAPVKRNESWHYAVFSIEHSHAYNFCEIGDSCGISNSSYVFLNIHVLLIAVNVIISIKKTFQKAAIKAHAITTTTLAE